MKARRHSHGKQHGFTFFELVIVLIVIGIAGGIVASRGSGTVTSSRITTEGTTIGDLTAAARLLRDRGGYTVGDLFPQLRNMGETGIPRALSDDGTTVTNTFGGTVTLVGTGPGFTITYGGKLPQEACVQLAMRHSNGGGVTTKINAAAAVTGPVSTAVATATCVAGDGNTLSFTVSS